jgi:hypothetical protein
MADKQDKPPKDTDKEETTEVDKQPQSSFEYPEDGDNSGKCNRCFSYIKEEGHKEWCANG